jgi:hypothetical protein
MMTPLPGKSFIVAGALAMSGIIAGAVSGGRAPAPVVTKATAAQFDQRWEDVSTDDQPLLKKQDRLALVAEPKVVPVERVVPPAAETVKVAAATASARRHTEQNICTRHGMHKVETHGGRSWRCRR